jgi:hypothetical protein
MRASCVLTREDRHRYREAHPADELRTLAGDVRRLGCAWRGDPEAIYQEKERVAARLRHIARSLDGGRL